MAWRSAVALVAYALFVLTPEAVFATDGAPGLQAQHCVRKLILLRYKGALVHAPKVGLQNQWDSTVQYAANSRDYQEYMDQVEMATSLRQIENEDTSVELGNKLMPPEQFKTNSLYLAYMNKLLKNGYQAPTSLVAHGGGDPIVDLDQPEGLGESAQAQIGEFPGQEFVASEAVPAVYEAARGRPTAQSSLQFGAGSDRAVDGRTDSVFQQGSCTHTKTDENPWWRVDLGQTMSMQYIQVFNRGDCCGDRLARIEVRVGDSKDWRKNPKCGQFWSVPQGQSLKIPCTALQGQYVFVVTPATKALTLCEVEVYASDLPGANAALGMPAEQSSTLRGGSAERAVDGHTNTNYGDNSCTHTEYELKPWWKVNLGKSATVSAVQIWNRGDCCGSRLSDFEVRVGNNPQIWSSASKCGEKWEIGQGEHKEIPCNGHSGKFVWVVLQGRNVLTLCEVRVLTIYPKQGVNLARSKPTEQSSTGYGGDSKRAVDGNIETNYKGGSCTHTHFDQEPWWRVDLEKSQPIGAVQIWNRGDCCGARLSDFEVRVGDGTQWQGNKVCGDKRYSIPQGREEAIVCGGAPGRYVYVVKRNQGYLNVCEVRVLPWKGAPQVTGDGCVSQALGVETRDIKAGDMTASSFYGNVDEYGPDNARLNYRGSAWQPLNQRVGEWIQVQLPKIYKVDGVATQGDAEADKWVTGYKVSYFSTAGDWKYVGGGDGEILPGNVDRNTVHKNTFKAPVDTNKIRVYPTNWKGDAALRLEVYGRSCETEAEQKVHAVSAPAATAATPCPAAPKAVCDGRRRRSLELVSESAYGEGKARLWYAETKGAAHSNIAAHSVYVSEGVDFRTEEGSIYAGTDLVAGRALRIQAWPGFGYGDAQLWYAQRAHSIYTANTLYLRSGDFRTQAGSIYAAEDVRAGRFLEVGAFPGFGDDSAKLWYSATGKGPTGQQYLAKTLYLKNGNFATQSGSITSAADVVASRYLSLKAFPNYGTGVAQFWYVQAGKEPYTSDTVYLKAGNLATEDGSIVSKYDVKVGANLRLQAADGYGRGETKLWYAKDSTNGYGPDSLYVESGDLKTQEGSIVAAKNLVAGRSVLINAYPGYGSGTAELMFSMATKGDIQANTLYLSKGDFQTKEGSIIAAKDLGAGRAVKIKSRPGNGDGTAELFYSHTAKGKFDAQTLYLKEGDFRTEKGSIHAGDSLRASKYLEIKAFPGFGEGSVKLWHSNREIEGYAANSLYLKDGDFRTVDGSIYASKDIVTQRYITINALEGFGSGSTKLWYSATGKGTYRSNALYLANGDFHTEAGSIFAKELHATKYLKVAAWPGHGVGFAELWHSKTEAAGFGADTLYLKKGHFMVQDGSLIAEKDVHAGRYIKVGAKQGFGTGSTQLWYSGSGKEGVYAHTLYLDSGDFRTQSGNIHSAKDVVAGGTLYGAKLEVNEAYVPGQVTAGHLFLGVTSKTPLADLLEGETELLDVGDEKQSAQKGINVAQVLNDLSSSNDHLRTRNSELTKDLEKILARISELEELARR